MDQALQNMAVKQEISPINEEFEMIFAGFGSLTERLSGLEGKLGTVLTPVPPSESSDAGLNSPNRGGSDTVYKLHEINMRIAGLENTVDSITRRLEL